MQTAQRVTIADLKGSDIFSGIPDESLEPIARYCHQQDFRVGEYAAIQGKATDHLLIVNSGKVAIEMRIDIPRYTHTINFATLTKGHVCAWSALVPPHVLTASVKCLENTQMLAIREEDLQRTFREKPAVEAVVMRNLSGIISSRLRDLHVQLTRLIAEVLKEGIKHKE
jgi:CRP-like cAMP-binding protein